MGDYLAELHEKHKARKLRLQQAAFKAVTVPEPLPQEPEPEPEPVIEPPIKITSNNFDLILNEVCRYYDVRKQDVLSHRNMPFVVKCRHMVAYQLYNFTKLTNPQIGAKLNRDPTSIWYAIRKVKDNREELKAQLDDLEKIISDLITERGKQHDASKEIHRSLRS